MLINSSKRLPQSNRMKTVLPPKSQKQSWHKALLLTRRLQPSKTMMMIHLNLSKKLKMMKEPLKTMHPHLLNSKLKPKSQLRLKQSQMLPKASELLETTEYESMTEKGKRRQTAV